ncbi:MAG: hypothetical protein N3A69_18345, partial [Leptospiraceae bacterium]|nr:hypothetical protein [Leptospiraceae bacterium]
DVYKRQPDMSVKIAAIRTLSEVGYKKEPNVLVSTLSDKNDDIKEAGIFAIQKLKLEEGSEELLKLLKNSDFTKNQTLINNAIVALAEVDSGKQGVDFLESKFREKTTHPNIRASIALYFGKVKALKTESTLQDVLVDEMDDPTTRAFAANALGKMNSFSSIPKLREVLDKINETKKKREVIVTSEEGEARNYLITYGSRIKVTDGDAVEAGDELTEGSV